MMKCKYCGHKIPDGMLRCDRCGQEVRIVPDYNPLDDVLEAQIKGSMDGTSSPLDDYEYRVDASGSNSRRQNATSIQRTNAGRYTDAANRTNVRRSTNSGRWTNTGRNSVNQSERERKRRQAEKKKAMRRKRRRLVLGMMLLFLLVIGVLIFVLYQNSYTGQVKKGNKAALEQNYDEAIAYYQKAMKKAPERPEAYTELSKIYVLEGDEEKAEEIFLSAVKKYPKNVELYEATIQFYISIEEEAKVSELLEDAEDSIRLELNEYISDPPEFSLDDSETYDDVQQLTLTSSGAEIYYTLDGSEPTVESAKKYTEPLQIGEGETTVKAISVNKTGIPSLSDSRTYDVKFPIEDAPAVTPSTGQYDSATEITINVPDGYTAYYTMDETEPSTSSTMYTGPIEMPEGTTIFKAILVNAKGRTSAITTRNYELTYE